MEIIKPRFTNDPKDRMQKELELKRQQKQEEINRVIANHHKSGVFEKHKKYKKHWKTIEKELNQDK